MQIIRCHRPSRLVSLLFPALCFAAVPVVRAADNEVDWTLLEKYCSECHNLDDQAGGIAFDLLQHDAVAGDADTWELAIRKIRTGMMPPAGKPRPARAVLDGFVASLANQLDSKQQSILIRAMPAWDA